MKKNFLLYWTLLFTLPACAQNSKLEQLLKSGKEEYQLQLPKQDPDFTKTYQLFREAVTLEPNNAEARYFLGYTIDKLSSASGESLNMVKRDLTIQASEQFEKVNQLSPIYKGELLMQDPYSKLTSIWGSLAFAYLSSHKEDSALWALREGKKRGGFGKAMLQFYNQALNECEANSVLITSGDAPTFNILYLQQVEHKKPDVITVDAGLIHSSWYPKYLKHKLLLPLSYTDEEIDSLNYEKWQPTQISLFNKKDSSQSLVWTLYPTYYRDYILKGDKILLDIFKQNYFQRNFYYTIPTDTSYNLFLTDYLKEEGLVLKVMSEKEDFDLWDDVTQKNFQNYSLDGLSKEELQKSPDVIMAYNNMRWAYVRRSNLLHSAGRSEEAQKLFKEVEARFPPDKLPIYPASYEKDYHGFRRKILNTLF
jgi:hypothetical protein